MSLSVCPSVCPSRSLLRRIKSVWKAGGIVRTVSARACYIPSFKKFHVRVHAISRNFTQFGLFQPFLGQFQHVGYQNACTRAEKFIGNTFQKFHARVHAISRNFHAILAISAIFGPISTCWVSKSMYSS